MKINEGKVPLKVYSSLSDFKLYMADVGMLTMQSGVAQVILSPVELNNSFLGSVAESYVAQAFVANSIPLYYWKNQNTAEVDFVIQHGLDIIPVEVKSGSHIRSKSLAMFMEWYKCPYAIRLSKKNFGFENNIKSVPLYAAFCIKVG